MATELPLHAEAALAELVLSNSKIGAGAGPRAGTIPPRLWDRRGLVDRAALSSRGATPARALDRSEETALVEPAPSRPKELRRPRRSSKRLCLGRGWWQLAPP
ncbi:MAG: hypothetical protein R3F40_10725 [Candidatus Competibacteraceae bacterium]